MKIMNKIYYLVMSMTVILLAACSQDEMEQVKERTLPELRVMVNHPSSISTRASVYDLTTTFTEGDQIGIFATDLNGDPVYINIPYVYKNINTNPDENPMYEWVLADESKTVYYSPNFSYYAYYPYVERDKNYWDNTILYYMDDPNDFFEYFISEWVPEYDQSTLENFNASDLMVGEGTDNSETASVAFTLNHQMGLVRIAYYDGRTQQYVEDISGLDSKTYFYNKDVNNCPVPYNTGNHYFYYIAKPGAQMEFWYMDTMTGPRPYQIPVDEDKGFISSFDVSPAF